MEEEQLKLTALVKQAQSQLQQGQIHAANTTAQQLISLHPKSRDGLYLLAVTQRYLHLPSAEATALQLVGVYPDYGRGYQELGHLTKQRDPIAALSHFSKATYYNPALLASWQAVDELSVGNVELQNKAKYWQGYLQQLPVELQSVLSMMHEGRLYKAENLCRFFLQRNAHHPEGMRLLAMLGVKHHVLDDAEFLLESCLALHQNHHAARMDYVTVLQKRQKFSQAFEEAKQLLEIDTDNTNYRASYANQCVSVGRFDEAIDIYEQLLAEKPDNADLWLVKGHAEKTVGKRKEAEVSYQQSYRCRPEFGDSYWSLANLKTYRFSDTEIAQMKRAIEAESTLLVDRYHMCFALGKALEDAKDYALSFEYYAKGNELKLQELQYSKEKMSESLRLQRALVTSELIEKYKDAGCQDSAPIFIVGLPRAGSTLIEQILASHSTIDGTFELPNILALAYRLNGRMHHGDEPKYPQNLWDISADKLLKFGEQFIEDTRIHRQNGLYFIDKMPNNFRHIGLIKLILPNAKIIDARRDPMACCFSGFKQLFAEGQEFTYGLENISQYYQDYVETMEHWQKVFPNQILKVQYENLVDDFENQVSKIFEYLEIPLETACLNFHETERSVRTASSEQVRQPIYRSGLAQWRRYEEYLTPLKQQFDS